MEGVAVTRSVGGTDGYTRMDHLQSAPATVFDGSGGDSDDPLASTISSHGNGSDGGSPNMPFVRVAVSVTPTGPSAALPIPGSHGARPAAANTGRAPVDNTNGHPNPSTVDRFASAKTNARGEGEQDLFDRLARTTPLPTSQTDQQQIAERETNAWSLGRAIIGAAIATGAFFAEAFTHEKKFSPALTFSGTLFASGIVYQPDGSLKLKVATVAGCILGGLTALLPKYYLTQEPTWAEVLASTIYGLSIAALWNRAAINPNDNKVPACLNLSPKQYTHLKRTAGAILALTTHKMAHAFCSSETVANTVGNLGIIFFNALAFPPFKPLTLAMLVTPPTIITSVFSAEKVKNESPETALALTCVCTIWTLAVVWYKGIERQKATRHEILSKRQDLDSDSIEIL